MDFAVLVRYKWKLTENEKWGKYLQFIIEQNKKKLWNMRLTVVPVVVGALGTVPKGLERRLKELKIPERIKTIQIIRTTDRLEYWEES